MYRPPRSPPAAGGASAGFAGRGIAGGSGGDDGGALFRRKQPAGKHRRGGSFGGHAGSPGGSSGAPKEPPGSTASGSSGGAGGGEKRGLLETIFSSKRRASSAQPRTPKLRPAPSPAAVARGVEILHSIFPKWEPMSLQIVLEANEFVMEDTITAVLNMEEAEDANAQGDSAARDSGGDSGRGFPVKNPLPDDFLRVSLSVCAFQQWDDRMTDVLTGSDVAVAG